MPARILILGGTDEARRLADWASQAGIDVVSSLAGRVRNPRLPVGEVRVGGFGGVTGLADYVDAERIVAVVDATHPFAEKISENAASAARMSGVPLLTLRRPGWTERDGDDWERVATLAAAANSVDSAGARVFLTTGRQGLGAFAELHQPWFLVRCVDPPDPPLPPHVEVILDRGPYTLDSERDLMIGHGISVLVTKDSGGELTMAKLYAARELSVPVVVVDRPPTPDGPSVETVADAGAWIRRVVDQSG